MKHSHSFLIYYINQFQRCPSPGQPRGICSRCQSLGWGIRNLNAARRLGISVPRGDPRAFDTRVFERWMSLSGRTEPLLKTDLSIRDQKNLSMFLKICSLNFRYFFFTYKHINISDKVKNFGYHKTITDEHCVNTTFSHFAFKSSQAIFKFMKVELKH